MNRKIVFALFVLILLVGIVLSEGETITPAPTKVIEVSGNTETPIGNLIGEGIGNSDITVKGVQYIKKENENTLISFLKGGAVIINGVKFENITESSTIELDKTGKIAFADLTASKDTSFSFKDIGSTFKCSQGQRAIYKDGKITFDKGNGKDSFSFRQDVYDSSGKNIGKFMNVKMNGPPVSIEKSKEGNNVFTGNFDVGESKINGRITLSKEGKISEVWKGTDATINNVDFKVSGNNLKTYYDDFFNISAHEGENYFNYAKNKIFVGGTGFTSDLTKSTNIFGDMKTAKEVTGIGTKTRNLDIAMNGGNLEISKDMSNPDMGFNIKSEGKFIINNGRDLISSDSDNILVKANPTDKEGLLYSYNLNFNNGEYKLEDNLFKNREGNILVNTNTPWETIAYNSINLDTTKEEIAKIEKITGTGTYRDWNFVFKDEELNKKIFEATEIANKNIEGITFSPTELAETGAREGWFFKPNANTDSVWEISKKDPEYTFYANQMSIGLSGIDGYWNDLVKGGYVSKDVSLVRSSLAGTQIKAKDLQEITAGAYAYFKSKAKNAIGEDKWNKLPDNMQLALATYAFNTGSPAKGDTLNALYSPVTVEKEYNTGVAKKNVKIGEAIYLDLKKYFNFL